MNPTKFSYIRSQSKKAYTAMFSRVRSWTKSFEIIRLWVLVVWFCINMFIYLYFVNRASTEWYFYGKAQEQKETAEFNYNITKLTIVEKQSQLRKTLLDKTKMKTVDLNSELITIEK